MNREQIIDILKTVKPHLEKDYGVTSIALFGSYSRGEETEKSDIDLLVEHTSPLGFRFLDMVYELDKIFKKEVQVVSKKGTNQKYLDAIKDDLIYV